MSLGNVAEFYVPNGVVLETERALRAAGRDGYECFVLWSGVSRDAEFEVRSCHRPAQTGYRLESGLCVRVDGDELHRLNRWLYEEGEVLAVQVHSHPTDAFHSDTDDSYPIVTTDGGLSVVVPHFGRDGLRGGGVAVFRLQAGCWAELPPDAAQALIGFGR